MRGVAKGVWDGEGDYTFDQVDEVGYFSLVFAAQVRDWFSSLALAIGQCVLHVERVI